MKPINRAPHFCGHLTQPLRTLGMPQNLRLHATKVDQRMVEVWKLVRENTQNHAYYLPEEDLCVTPKKCKYASTIQQIENYVPSKKDIEMSEKVQIPEDLVKSLHLKLNYALLVTEFEKRKDAFAETFIREKMERILQKRNNSLIENKLPSLTRINHIVVYDKGECIEEGSHLELMTEEGHYARMWQKQFEAPSDKGMIRGK